MESGQNVIRTMISTACQEYEGGMCGFACVCACVHVVGARLSHSYLEPGVTSGVAGVWGRKSLYVT